MRANWSAETEATLDTSTGADVATTTRQGLKRQKANTTAFFGDSDESEEVEEQEAIKDELMDYFALPQIKYRTVGLRAPEGVPKCSSDGTAVFRLSCNFRNGRAVCFLR